MRQNPHVRICGGPGSATTLVYPTPIRQGVRERFGAIGKGVARGLRLRHDHGSNYLADDFQQEVAFFGIESSPSFVREPEGNGVAERFIRTLKENLLWVRSFDTVEELRLAVLAFKRTYNEQWMLEKYGYRSPAQVRRDLVRSNNSIDAVRQADSTLDPRRVATFVRGVCYARRHVAVSPSPPVPRRGGRGLDQSAAA